MMKSAFLMLALLSFRSLSSASSPINHWYDHAVIYEIYPRSFQDSNGDGIGDLNGITARLDYLKQLGIDAIWITPFFPSPNADFGYDVSDYVNVAPEYGTLQDWDKLVAEARKRGIRVLVDFVVNPPPISILGSRSRDPRVIIRSATGTYGGAAEVQNNFQLPTSCAPS
jgi:pullulanase/glycogen debranching enzyme